LLNLKNKRTLQKLFSFPTKTTHLQMIPKEAIEQNDHHPPTRGAILILNRKRIAYLSCRHERVIQPFVTSQAVIII